MRRPWWHDGEADSPPDLDICEQIVARGASNRDERRELDTPAIIFLVLLFVILFDVVVSYSIDTGPVLGQRDVREIRSDRFND